MSLLAIYTVIYVSFPYLSLNILFEISDLENITKVGEGTYGEAFKVGNNVCKIVPFDGDLLVNGELQKVKILYCFD